MTDIEKQHNIEYLLNQLEIAGKRSTPQRYAVCQALVEHGGHPTVAEVFERVRTTFPMISQATVYNTLDTLKELGLVHQLDLANDEHAHYDLDPRRHINVVCTHCGRITDVHSDKVDVLLEGVSQHSGYRLCRRNALVVYGVCPDCQAIADADPCSFDGSLEDYPHRKAGKVHGSPGKGMGHRQRRRNQHRHE